jgi:cytochrome c-type biogenesis protein CcmH/NrfG
MILFWAIGAALAAAALLLVLRPLLARRGGGGVSRRAANIAIYRDQMRGSTPTSQRASSRRPSTSARAAARIPPAGGCGRGRRP